jgi:hypothetical protein
VLDRLIVSAKPEQRLADPPLQSCPFDRIPSILEGTPVSVECPAVRLERLRVSGDAAGLISRPL